MLSPGGIEYPARSRTSVAEGGAEGINIAVNGDVEREDGITGIQAVFLFKGEAVLG